MINTFILSASFKSHTRVYSFYFFVIKLKSHSASFQKTSLGIVASSFNSLILVNLSYYFLVNKKNHFFYEFMHFVIILFRTV